MDDKIIVSNRSALATKYGAAGLAKIVKAIRTLIAADAKRGIKSRIVYVDDASAMRRLHAHPVTEHTSAPQNKRAIDEIVRRTHPDYLMILGSVDVVPHQDMRNPLFDPADDPDKSALGDLPYACDQPYSRDVARFKGPTRVLGRLPDLTGAKNPTHLLALLATAAQYRSRKVADYRKYFGLSTYSWRKPSALILVNVFGESDNLTLSPPRGPGHSAKRLAPLSHYINCHGDSADPNFLGQQGHVRPKALTSNSIAHKIKRGTVASVECCYGAQLYDSIALAGPLPICQQYLGRGAYGYFGSTTIAYGLKKGNGAADLITQYFLSALLEGRSLGSAALIARQRFANEVTELDPMDLKTLAQFNLLGDPSLHPAIVESPANPPSNVNAERSSRQKRRERRAKFGSMGTFLQVTKPTASRKVKVRRRSNAVQQVLTNIGREAGIDPGKKFTAFAVKVPPGARQRRAPAGPLASRYHVAVYKKGKRAQERRVAVVAKEVNGRIIDYRIYTER